MNNQFSDLDLARYFTGECSPEEKLRVEDWRDSSLENREKFYAAKFVWERTASLEKIEFDTEKALSKVNLQLDTLSHSPRKRISFPIYSKIAAIAAIMLLPVLYIFFMNNGGKIVEESYSIISSAKEIRHITLADSSEVWLNINSELSVPQKQKGTEFKIKLDGEAFFQIAQNPQRVFIIETGQTRVEVLGTAFNLKAIKSNIKTVLSVTEGKVLYTNNKIKNSKVVEKGSEAIIESDRNAITVQPISDNNLLAWKTRMLKFRDTPLKEAFNTLSDFYQVKFEVTDSSLMTLPISTTLVNQPADDVVNVLNMVSEEFIVTKTQDGYQASKKK